MAKKQVSELQKIPGIGEKLAQYFRDAGIKNIQALKGNDPEDIYRKICDNHGYRVDRCVLYVCRLAVYFADNEKHDPQKLKWWYWKDNFNSQAGSESLSLIKTSRK